MRLLYFWSLLMGLLGIRWAFCVTMRPWVQIWDPVFKFFGLQLQFKLCQGWTEEGKSYLSTPLSHWTPVHSMFTFFFNIQPLNEFNIVRKLIVTKNNDKIIKKILAKWCAWKEFSCSRHKQFQRCQTKQLKYK